MEVSTLFLGCGLTYVGLGCHYAQNIFSMTDTSHVIIWRHIHKEKYGYGVCPPLQTLSANQSYQKTMHEYFGIFGPMNYNWNFSLTQWSSATRGWWCSRTTRRSAWGWRTRAATAIWPPSSPTSRGSSTLSGSSGSTTSMTRRRGRPRFLPLRCDNQGTTRWHILDQRKISDIWDFHQERRASSVKRVGSEIVGHRSTDCEILHWPFHFIWHFCQNSLWTGDAALLSAAKPGTNCKISFNSPSPLLFPPFPLSVQKPSEVLNPHDRRFMLPISCPPLTVLVT